MNKLFQLALAWLILASPIFAASTYYIDYVGGSDSNNGAAKTTPWQHAPGMFGATGNAASQAPAAGDSYILKGGTTWPNASLGWIWIGSGNATTSSPGCTGSGCIYIGVDKTWFANITGTVNTTGNTVTWVSGVRSGGDLGYLVPGNTITINGTAYTVASVASATTLTLTSSAGTQSGVSFSYSYWTRPILNGGGAPVHTSNGVVNVLLYLYGNYLVVDNIEITGLYWSGTPAYGSSVNFEISAGTPNVGTNIEIEHVYIHGWSHGTYASGTHEQACGVEGDTATPNNNARTIIHDSVIDGSDTDQKSCTAIFGSPPYIQHNIFQYVTSGYIGSAPVLIDGNTILHVQTSFDTTPAHTNALELNTSQNVTISSNLIAHLQSGTLGIWCAPDVGFTCTLFNNVIYDTDTGNVLDPAPAVANNGCPSSGNYCTQGGSMLIYNNTIECGPDSGPNAICANGIPTQISAITFENNQFITNNSQFEVSVGPIPVTTANLLQSLATANGQGYTSAETYPFSPNGGAGSTVLSGVNLTGICSGSLATLCQDTPLGVAYNPLNHTVTAPYRTSNPRPPSGSWDIGAYEWTGALSAPGAPAAAFMSALPNENIVAWLERIAGF